MLISRSRLDLQRMGVLLAFGHGEVERLLGGDRLVKLIVEGAVATVDVQFSTGLHVPVGLDSAALPLPIELLGFMSRQGFIERSPAPEVLLYEFSSCQPFRLNLRHMRALVRHITAQRLGQLLPIACKDLGILRTA